MGVKISALPSVSVPALTDVFPIVQAGVTYKETCTQLAALIGGSIAPNVLGTPNQIIVTPGVGNVTLSTPQDIATTSNVTFGSVTFNPTTKGIVGTPTNNNAAAGFVGEFISSTIASGSAVPILNATPTDLTFVDLTAGDWNVWGNITYLQAPTTSVLGTVAWTSSTSATLPDVSLTNATLIGGVVGGAGSFTGNNAPFHRYSLSITTRVFLTGIANFTVSTMTMCGGIFARRVR
jgi:hypothetical protein